MTPGSEDRLLPTPTAPQAGTPTDWESIRDSGIPPRVVSSYQGSEAYRDEFRQGCAALGLKTIHPQQMVIADAVNATTEAGAPLHPFVGVVVPRRASKSTSLVALALGRCLARPGYLVGVTFTTTAQKLSARFKSDYFPVLEAWADTTFGDTEFWPFKITLTNGAERITFKNGSRLDLLAARAASFRSEAYDLVICDEAGEADAVLTETLLQAILPVFDTRDGQLVVAGTAAAFRDGNLLYDTIHDGRTGQNDTGIVEYSAGEDLTLEDVESWAQVEPLLLAAHPGVDTLTNMTKLRRNYGILGPKRFAQEYLSIFGQDGATAGVISPAKWKDCESSAADFPQLPDRFAVGVAAYNTAAIVAAWRDADGQAHLLMLEHKDGTQEWLAPTLLEFARKYPTVPIAYDRGEVLVAINELQRARPVPRLVKATTETVTTSAALLVREVHTGHLVHYGQAELTSAALAAARRDIGAPGRAWGFGRVDLASDIVPLEAAALALHTYDQTPAPRQTPAFMLRAS